MHDIKFPSVARAIARWCLYCFWAMPMASQAEVVVIVNMSNEQPLDLGAVARIFLAQAKNFPSGVRAISVDQKVGTKVREEFEDKLSHNAPAGIKTFWARQKFTGALKPLPTFDSDAAMIEYVATTPNAIGYVDAAKVNGKVRVILTL